MSNAGLFCCYPLLSAGADVVTGICSLDKEGHMPDVIPVPDNPNEWNEFRQRLQKWKQKARKEVAYDDSLYKDPSYHWAASAYNCYFLMMYDESFYDRNSGEYKAEEWIDRLTAEYGRIDTIVLWHAYPRIGLDDRNQFDFYRDMPGGLKGIRKVSDLFHEKNIKVFINYNPWDTATRREGISDINALCSILKEIDGDGVFLDTMQNAESDFRIKLDGIKAGIVQESELALPVCNIKDHHLSWAQWFSTARIPGILRNKWFEQRHIQHAISRWTVDKTNDIQLAWMNGSGIMIWENVFGQWMKWKEKDKFQVRIMASIQKRFAELFSMGQWTVLASLSPIPFVYAHLWEHKGVRLWTLVNTSDETVKGEILHILKQPGEYCFDLVKGTEVKVNEYGINEGKITGEMPAGSIGCFVALGKDHIDQKFLGFVDCQRANYLKGYSEVFTKETTVRIPIVRTKSYKKLPDRMLRIKGVSKKMNAIFRIREVGYYDSLDESFMNAVYPRLHDVCIKEREVHIHDFAIDETPVTNQQFYEFLKETGYLPQHRENFLKHWNNGNITVGMEEHPVVYVDLEDARAYATWVGKRLPTEEEWQYAAQGDMEYKYPWGNQWFENKCNTGIIGCTTPVYAYPDGRSVFGCYDMCGNVWELTESEHSDGHNRFCILKGGSYYNADTSEWYFDGGIQTVDYAAKQLLMYPGIDRCATIGFRCVIDL